LYVPVLDFVLLPSCTFDIPYIREDIRPSLLYASKNGTILGRRVSVYDILNLIVGLSAKIKLCHLRLIGRA